MVKFSKKDFDGKRMAAAVMLFWSYWYKIAFFLTFFGLCAFGIVFWQQSLHTFQWSDAQKQEYKNSRLKRTVFNQSDFDKVLSNIERRKDVYSSEYIPVRDIFKDNQGNTAGSLKPSRP